MPKSRYKLEPGETYIGSRGYIYEKCPDHPACNNKGYVRQHRLVIERSIGRYLTGTEVVHHKNKNTSDNRLENLQLCKNETEHNLIHSPPRFCHCGEPHCAKGLCRKHYYEWAKEQGMFKTAKCWDCGIAIYPTSKRCNTCRFKPKFCSFCGEPSVANKLCRKHYQERWRKTNPRIYDPPKVPCSKCGNPIRISGRNHFPPVCWDCRYPKQKCRICGGKHEAHGLCDNHYKQLRRGTLKE